MRWQILVQALVGLGVLFGLGHLAIEREVVPIVQQSALQRSEAEAQVGTLLVERAWTRSQASLKAMARNLAKSPVYQRLKTPEGFELSKSSELLGAISGAQGQLGQGLVVVTDSQGQPVGGFPSLVSSVAVKEALQTIPTAHIEVVDGKVYEIAAAPIWTTGESQTLIGVIALARLFDSARLSVWLGRDISSYVALVGNKQLLVSTLPKDLSKIVSSISEDAHEIDFDGKKYAISSLSLLIEGANNLRVYSFARLTGGYEYQLLKQFRLLFRLSMFAAMVLVVGVFLFNGLVLAKTDKSVALAAPQDVQASIIVHDNNAGPTQPNHAPSEVQGTWMDPKNSEQSMGLQTQGQKQSPGLQDLPMPKGGLSPGMLAAQQLSERGPVMAPSPRFDKDLPMPKDKASDIDSQKIPTGLSGPDVNAVVQKTDRTASPYDESHYQDVFNDFVSARQRIGESVANLNLEEFKAKLRSSEEGLIKRYNCRAVRFQVMLKDKTVSLRPQLVR